MALAPLPGPNYNPFTFIWILSGVFGAIIAFGPLLVPRRPDRGVIRISIILAAFHMWVVWVVIYISQMHPVNHNVYRNTTLAWISYKWGDAKNIPILILPTLTPPTPESTTKSLTAQVVITSRTTTTSKVKQTTKRRTKPTTPTAPLPPGVTPASTTSTPEGPTPAPPTTKIPSTFADGSLVPTLSASTETFYYVPFATANEYEFFKVYTKYSDRGMIIFSVLTSKPAEVTISDRASPSKGERIICTYGVGNKHYRIERLKKGDMTRTPKGVAYDYMKGNLKYEVVTNKMYKRFYLRWRDGRFWMGDDYYFLTPITHWEDPNPFSVKFVSFYSADSDAKWFIERGVEDYIPVPHSMFRRRHMKYYDQSDWTNRTSFTVVKSFYKFHYIRSEPIWLCVNTEDTEYKQFFVLLSKTYIKVKPYLLIHIGGANGKQCTISKNTEVMVRVNCGIEWRKNSYINFWIWFKRGQIDVYSGFDNINLHHVISWTDPELVMYRFYGLRTGVGEFVSMQLEGTRTEEED